MTPNGWIMLCTPPESITSAPRRMISTASPIAWALAAQAVRHERFGPFAPKTTKPPQEGGFFAVIAHEELAQPETCGLNVADSDQKSISAGATRQAGGFGIEEGPLGRMRRGDRAVRERIQQVGRQFVQIRDIHAAVAPVPLEQLLGFEVFAARGVDHFAADELLNEVARRTQVRDARGLGGLAEPVGLARPLPVDTRDAPPQYGELFLDILHCSPFICQLG